MLYSIARFVLMVFVKIFFRVDVQGNNYIPSDKAYILACNHTSNFDVVVVMAKTKNRKIHFLAKKELFKNKIIAYLLEKAYTIPIDRQKNDMKALKRCLNVLKNNEVLGIFPQGTRVKQGQDEDAKLGIGMFAVTTNTPVIPVSIITQGYKPFSKIKIIYHEPYNVPLQIVEDRDKTRKLDNYKKVADEVMNIINLKQN